MHWTLDPRKWFKKKVKKPQGIVGIAFDEQGVALSHMKQVDGTSTIVSLDFSDLRGTEQESYVKNWVLSHNLKNADCHLVLRQGDYALELIERPPVDEEELHEAVRWRLKEIINLPIEDTAIDVFQLPEDAYRGRKKMLYVVAVLKSIIKEKIKFIKKVGLDLKVIDIEELVLRNISLYIPEVDQGTVTFLSIKENNGKIYMFNRDNLYLARSMEIGYSSFIPNENDELMRIINEDEGALEERFVLDVQRSIDFYESQLGKVIGNRLYLLPSEFENERIVGHLQNMLAQQVDTLNCKEILPLKENINIDNKYHDPCLLAIGAVFRRGDHAAG